MASYAQKNIVSAKPVQPQAPIAAVGRTACATVTGSSTDHAHSACTVQKESRYRGKRAGPVSHGSPGSL